MTPNPVSSSLSSAPAGPAAVVGSAPPGVFAQALAQQRTGQATPPPPPAQSPPSPPGPAAHPSGHQAARPAPAPASGTARAAAHGSLAAHAKTNVTAKDIVKDTADPAAKDAAAEASSQDEGTGPAAEVDALLARLSSAEPAATASEGGGTPKPWLGQAAADRSAAAAAAHTADAALAKAAASTIAGDARGRVDLAAEAARTTATATAAAAAEAARHADTASGAAANAMAPSADVSADALQTLAGAAHANDKALAASQTGLNTGPATAPGAQAALAAAALPTPLPGSAGSAGAPLPEARLPAPPGHADFAPQLGAQISVFVREGVQQARLQLNPAEMGPITVQIRLDGTAAQVHLTADNALTRQALEQAMPTLAGSLREGGLTLTGGGVFEKPAQPGQAQADANADRSPRGAPGDGRDGDAAQRGHHDGQGMPAGMLRSRGVVDLVA